MSEAVKKEDKKKDKKKNRLQGGGAKKPSVPSKKSSGGAGNVWSEGRPDMSKEEEYAAHLQSLQVISNANDPRHTMPSGLCVMKDFITKAEEAMLISFFDSQEWDPDTPLDRRTQQWGYAFDYREMTVLTGARPLPDVLGTVLQRMRTIQEKPAGDDGIEQFPYPEDPEQMIVNEYRPGQGIHPHVDRQCFGPCVASLSLGGDVFFEFDKIGATGSTTVLNDFSKSPSFAQRQEAVSSPHMKKVFMPRRTLVMMRGDARYGWTHGIPFCTYNELPTGREQRERRVSLTFRTLTDRSREAVGKPAVNLDAAWKKGGESGQ